MSSTDLKHLSTPKLESRIDNKKAEGSSVPPLNNAELLKYILE